MKTRDPNIPTYSNSPGDYTGPTIGGAGVCEIQGRRYSQEDAIAIDDSAHTAEFAKFNQATQAAVMKNTYAKLQAACGQSEQGSCVCNATGVRQGNKVIVSTSFVGDSVAFLIVLDKNGNLKKDGAIACNTDLHDANSAKEKEAIEKGIGRKKGVVLHGLWGPEIDNHSSRIAVTRALGDIQYDEHGISHEPETIKKIPPFELADDDIAYMVVGCDGIMEHLKGDGVAQKAAQEIGELFSEKFKENRKDASELAEAIVANAIQNKSKDNISAVVVPLLKGKPAITAAVMDGHGGPDVSKAISENFSTCFAEAVNEKQAELRAKPRRVLPQTTAQRTLAIPTPPKIENTAVPIKMDLDKKLTEQIKKNMLDKALSTANVQRFDELTFADIKLAHDTMLQVADSSRHHQQMISFEETKAYLEAAFIILTERSPQQTPPPVANTAKLQAAPITPTTPTAPTINDVFVTLKANLGDDIVKQNCTLKEATDFLINTRQPYLLRQGSNDNSITLSYLSAEDGKVYHARLTRTPGTYSNNIDDILKDFVGTNNMTLELIVRDNSLLPSHASHNPAVDNPNLMIISTQVSASNPSSTGAALVSLGGTGRAIHSYVGGGIMHMHRDKGVNDNDIKEMSNHLHPGGWLVISGHGSIGGKEISGDYEEAITFNKVDVHHTPKEYVDVILNGSSLTAGTHINIILNVCYAAQDSATSTSFAKKLAAEFAAHGISTSITASVNPVGRIGAPDTKQGDIKNHQIRFRAKGEDIRQLNTEALFAGGISRQTEERYYDKFMISRFGCGYRSKIEMNLIASLNKPTLEPGDHKVFANALAYFNTRAPDGILESHRTKMVMNLFNRLPKIDKDTILIELKQINTDIHKQMLPPTPLKSSPHQKLPPPPPPRGSMKGP